MYRKTKYILPDGREDKNLDGFHIDMSVTTKIDDHICEDHNSVKMYMNHDIPLEDLLKNIATCLKKAGLY